MYVLVCMFRFMSNLSICVRCAYLICVYVFAGMYVFVHV